MTAWRDAPGFSDAFVRAGVSGLGECYASGTFSAVDVTRGYLARIDRHNPALNAFVDLDPVSAMAAAEASAARWSRDAALSPIDGVPIGIKSNIAVRGLPWTAGLSARRGHCAVDDASCVAHLRAAGAVVLGTLNMDEAALGGTGENHWFGRTRNPHDLGFIAGGSSAGAGAAVAAGLCAAALGTDTMGSVRIPAACCGVVGHSPVRGAIASRGVVPLSWTYDNVGVLARSVQDVACILAALVERSEACRPQRQAASGDDVAVLVLPEGVALEPAALAAFEAGLQAAGAAGLHLHPVQLQDFDVGRAGRALLRIVETEAWVEHEALLRDQAGSVSPQLRGMLEWGARQSAGSLAGAYRSLRDLGDSIHAQLAPWSGLLAPVMTRTAYPFEQPAPPQLAAFTMIGSIAGLSGMSLPMAPAAGAMPGAVQVLSTRDVMTIALAQRIAGALTRVGVPASFAS